MSERKPLTEGRVRKIEKGFSKTTNLNITKPVKAPPAPKLKAENLDKLREIFKKAFFVRLDDSKFEELGEFVYKPLLNGAQITEAYECDEEVALACDGKYINDIMKILGLGK